MTPWMKRLAGAILVVFAFAAHAAADRQLEVGPAIVLTDQAPDGNLSAKIKIVRLGNGVLVVAYAEFEQREIPYSCLYGDERLEITSGVRTHRSIT